MSGVIGEALIDALRCPETGQKLKIVSRQSLAGFQQAIDEKRLRRVDGEALKGPLEGALLTEDGSRLFPIREGFPVLLIAESMVLDGD
ncbi:MAG: hypothetical protein AAF514_13520 [Verrucomicrobiota bacterium]